MIIFISVEYNTLISFESSLNGCGRQTLDKYGLDRRPIPPSQGKENVKLLQRIHIWKQQLRRIIGPKGDKVTYGLRQVTK
jgi:hypothetical protein